MNTHSHPHHSPQSQKPDTIRRVPTQRAACRSVREPHKPAGKKARISRQDAAIVEYASAYILSLPDEQIRNLQPSAVAAAVGTCRAVLNGLFLTVHRLTIDAFIQREKIHRVYFALRKNRALSLDHLAATLGFKNLDALVETFEKYFLITPVRFCELKREIKTGGKNQIKLS